MALSVNIEKRLGNFLLKAEFDADNCVTAILGASGAGKSMTLKCIAGIEKPDKGRIVLNDKVLFDSEKGINLPPQKRNVGYLFQQYALFPGMTVGENILCGVRSEGLSPEGKVVRRTKEEKQRIADEIMETMHILELKNKKPHQLSGGQQQRTALARILVNEPEVLLLDEPFSALDAHLRFQMEEEVGNIIREFGKTAILVSHDRDEVFRLSRDIAIMHRGLLQAFGDKHQVFEDPKTVNGAILTGCKNISKAQPVDSETVLAEDWGIQLRVRPEGKNESVKDKTGLIQDGILDQPLNYEERTPNNQINYLGIRMHDIEFGLGENHIRAKVISETENPFSVTVRMEPIGGKGIIAIQPSKAMWKEKRSEILNISIPPEKILLLR